LVFSCYVTGMNNYFSWYTHWFINSNQLDFKDRFFWIDIEQYNKNSQKLYDKFIFKNWIFVTIVGYISNIRLLSDRYWVNFQDELELIHYFYSKYKFKRFSELDWVYNICIYDWSDIYIFKDIFDSNKPLYYYKSSVWIIFSNTLKTILNKLPKKTFDPISVNAFLYTEYMVPNKKTLIKHVYKIPPQKILKYNIKTNQLRLVSYKQKNHKNLESDIIKLIDNNTRAIVQRTNYSNLWLAISSGYDSNLLFHTVKEIQDGITLFTIWGKENNEIPTVKAMYWDLFQSNNIKHKSSIVESRIVDFLPDIVYRLEGYAFERGIFLQYQFAKLLMENHIWDVILGEGADQIFDSTRATRNKRIAWCQLNTKFVGFLHDDFQLDYDIEFDVVLKKSWIMLSSFWIAWFYPFLSTDLLTLPNWQRTKYKSYYKNQVENYLDPNLIKYIKKIWWSTDLWYLLEENKSILLSIIKTKFIKNILWKRIYTILRDPQKYVTFIFQLVYLYIFSEIFLSWKYDNNLNNDGFEFTLHDLLGR